MSSYLIDPESVTDQIRLWEQGKFLDQLLADDLLPHPFLQAPLYQVLDVGSGPGCWALDVIEHQQNLRITGIDISERNVTYANRMAIASGKDAYVSFEVADATKRLPYLDEAFHIVHARAVAAFLSKKVLQPFFQELLRVTKKGGIVRSLECDRLGKSNSPAFEAFQDAIIASFSKRAFSLEQIGSLFLEEEVFTIKYHRYELPFHRNHPFFFSYLQDLLHIFELIKPAVLQEGNLSEKKYDILYENTLSELRDPAFEVVWTWHCYEAMK